MAFRPVQSGNINVASYPDAQSPLTSTYTLPDAYAHCRQITRSASKSFFLAAALLPSDKRRAIEALYAFARTSDNLVDEHADPAVALKRWIDQTHASEPGDDPVLIAWADTCARYNLPCELADELLAGVGMDLTLNRYATFDELRLYCYRVASVVGLLSMHIIGYTPEAEEYAIQLGIALQLTNILRDIGEDAARGRIYIPLEDLKRFGVSEQELLEGKQSSQYHALMRWQIERAEALYQSSWPGIALLHRDGQFAVAAAALLYRAILPKIVANEYDVFTKRAYVSTSEKFRMLPRIRIQLNALRNGNTTLPALRWRA